MAKRKMSSGFASSDTSSIDGLNREVESRLSESMEKSFEEFDYTADTEKGSEASNRSYQKRHDDYAAQAEDDLTDQMVHEWQSEIKRPRDQFPGAKMKKRMSPAGTVGSDNASYDPHQGDPSRLKGDHMPYESKKQRGWMHIHEPEIAAKWDKEGGQVKASRIDSGEKLTAEVDKRMKRLAGGPGDRPDAERKLQDILSRAGITVDVGWSGRSVAIGCDDREAAQRVASLLRQSGAFEITGVSDSHGGPIVMAKIK